MLRDVWPEGFGDDAFRAIARVSTIERLVNMYCRTTTDRTTEHLRDMPRLKSYLVWGAAITGRSLELLAGMPTLEELLFWSCDIGDDGLARLAALPLLRKLDLQQNARISAAGVARLPQPVQVNFQPA